MLGTRAAAFAGKISNLRESILRIQNGTIPQPTCLDLSNMMKYFCQVLHDFRDFKDIENVPLYANEKKDQLELIKTLPNFDYSGLYKALNQLIDIFPLIPQASNGFDQLSSNLLMLFKCLVPFLDQANMETMPYLITTLFMSLPTTMHKDILDTLCFNLLPFTIDQQQKSTKLMRKMAKRERQIKRQLSKSSGGVRTSGKQEAQRPVHCIVRIEDSSDVIKDRPRLKGDSLEDQGIEVDSGELDPAEGDLQRQQSLKAEVGGRRRLGGEENSLEGEEEEEEEEGEDYALLSVTSILMVAFHYIQEPMHHSQLIECLMKLKSNVFEDLLFVIAYGTTRARCPAVEILFRYWPDICPNQQDRKNNSQTNSKLRHVSWQPMKCQNKNCTFSTLGDDEAVKMCLDFKISISLSELPPPMLVCLDCVDSIYNQQDGYNENDSSSIRMIENFGNKFIDLLLPMEQISTKCENKNCKSTDQNAIGTCFDIECCNYNGKKPIRYCRQCFVNIHEPCEANNHDVTLQSHIRHSSIKLTIMENEESVNNFVEAIISLLKEAAPADRPSKDSERYLRSLMGPMSQFNNDNKDLTIATEEKQLISQYGIWLMTGLCKKVDKLSDELLGHLLGMLFQWFHFTACLPDDQAGSALEKLKGECIKGWILGVKNQRLDVFISCLLPHPIDCSKIGGHWEVWPDTAHQIKEGFKRLLCLVPYDIITDDVWDEIMPYWMECFRFEVPENELSELKILLSKVFDPELSPLGFDTKQMYNFISSRLEDSRNLNQEQTLYWLQIITMLEIPIPIDFLFKMLKSGVESLARVRENELNKMKELRAAREAAANEQRQQTTSGENQSSGRSTPNSSANEPPDAFSPTSAQNFNDDAIELANESTSAQASAAAAAAAARKERQQQARAAFSARIMQHASLLDAQQPSSSIGSASSIIGSPTTIEPTSVSSLSSSLTNTTAVMSPTGQKAPAAAAIVAAALNQSKGAAGQQQAARTAAGAHSRQLKSTSSSTEFSAKQTLTSSKAKLKLQVNGSNEDSLQANKVDNNLVCYILMMDILLKQLDLQEISSHRGLDGHEAQQAIELLNGIISTPWLGKHTCCDTLPGSSSSRPPTPKPNATSPANHKNEQQATTIISANVHNYNHCVSGYEREDTYETCVFCEIISTFHQLAMSLIEFFSPLIEVSICEVSQDAANGEFDGKPDYSRVGLDHLDPSPSALDKHAAREFSFNEPNNLLSKQQLEPNLPFSPSYFGPSLKAEVLEKLPKELQLSYNLLVQFHQFQTPDIVSQLLQMIKLVSLHSQVLSKAAKKNPEFITWCQHNMLVNKLWSLCQLESSEIARTCVPLLLHCITLPWGVRLFRDLVEKDFNSENYLSRFEAVERVVTIAYFCEPSTIKNSTLLQSTMASAFCFVVRCLDDIEAIVAQRALVSLEMMRTSSLKLLLWCLEVQFDCIIIDRPMILRTVFQLYNHLKDRRFLTWEFFLNRFDTIFLEAQVYLQQTREIPSFTMQDLKNTNTKSEIYQKKIMRAKEALQETHHSRSLSTRFNIIDNKHANKQPQPEGEKENPADLEYKESIRLQHHLQSSAEIKQDLSAAAAAAAAASAKKSAGPSKSPLKRATQHGRSISSRYQSVAYLTSQSMIKRKNSKFMTNLAMQSVPPVMSLPDKLHQHLPNSFVDDGSKLNEIAQENHVFGVVHRICDEDRDTNHSLIFLLMQFFSKPDPSHPQSHKTLNRSHQIVLRHLNILMGYSVARKNFLISASNLRLLPVFNAFLTSLPKVLDFNYSLGTILLDTCLPILIYCPAPDEVQFDSMCRPNYSLWLLNPLLRQSWLMSIMTFLYKYQFNQANLKDQVRSLMWIVINTLESHLNIRSKSSAPQLVGLLSERHLNSARGDSTTTVTAIHEIPAADPEPEGAQPAKSSRFQASQENSLGVNNAAVVVDVNSPARSGKIVEMIEMQHQQQPLSSIRPMASSASSSSLKQSGEPSPSHSKTLPASSVKSLIKADTSDSLNVKAKLFQRKTDAQQRTPKTACSSTGASATKLNLDPEAAKPLEDSNSHHERLLPIGPQMVTSSKTRSAFDLPATERLLPIGNRQPLGTLQSSLIVGRSVAGDTERLLRLEPMEMKEPPVTSTNFQSSSVVSESGGSLSRIGGKQAKSQEQRRTNDSPIEPSLSGSVGSASNIPLAGSTAFKRNNKKRFGGKQANEQQQQQQQLVVASKSSSKADQLMGIEGPGASQSSETAVAVKKGAKGKNCKEYVPKQVQTLQPSYSSPSLLNEQLAQVNRHAIVEEFSDKDLSMCLVILETFIHHEPSMAAQMLPNILRLIARYSLASQESSQSGSGNAHLVGGSMFVARQFIRVALHDLMENNIFHQIFTSHFTGYDFYKSMAVALADFADLNQLAPLIKLFEDLNKQKNLPQAGSLMTILENVATYFECTIAESSSLSQTTWNNFINNWDNFLRKLILALPRYSGGAITTTTSGGTSSMTQTNFPQSSPNTNNSQFLSPRNVATIGAPNAISGSVLNQENVNIASSVPSSCSMIMTPIMRIILSTSKISHLASCKTIVDPYSKIISYTVLHSQFKYEHLLEINHNCCRLYTREREKYLIQRTIAYELVQVLKFRFFILEENLLILLLFILQDVGGTLAPKVVTDSLRIDQATLNQAESFITNVSECLRQYIGDLLEFITDVHAISRINDNLGSQPRSINRDSFGGHVKAAISQYLALEMSLSNGADNRCVIRYLPWLYSSPSLQQGPREFIDCVSHIRQLSWIILGSLQHSTIMKLKASGYNSSTSSLASNNQHAGQSATLNPSCAAAAAAPGSSSAALMGPAAGSSGLASHNAGHINCQPIPIEKNGVAEHIQVILAGFADQSKESVLHMSGLFHAFLLCQLWTMYCENICNQHPANSEQYQFCQSTLDDFWAKITPGVLRLVGHSRVMSEMVSTHFLQLIESLIESNSSILIRYLPMWNSVFNSYKKRNKSGNIAIRLQKCIEWQPPDLDEQDVEQNNKRLMNWLEKVQYKMSHIEIQSSQAAPFYLT